MVVVDVKYDEYALVHVVSTKEEHLTVVAKLYSKPVFMTMLYMLALYGLQGHFSSSYSSVHCITFLILLLLMLDRPQPSLPA